jgi:hypothetical protein
MIICFECPEDKKRRVDEAIARGGYRDYSEFILVAIANQLLLHSRVGASSGVVIQPVMGTGLNPANTDDPGRVAAKNELVPAPASANVPTLFRAPSAARHHRFARPPSDVFADGESVPVERWIFGQYNRLLPAKASCRAIANLQLEHPDGLELDATAVQIAREARVLGTLLERNDAGRQTDRDERLSTAFPMNDEKGLARFANQFVGAINSHGQLSGLLASLKLIGRADTKRRRILLTEAGWTFANLKNPCIDDETDDPTEKLSPEEKQFLCNHIRRDVPQEMSAYSTIIGLIQEGHATPDALDIALRERVTHGFAASDSFVATQRTGAISRMTDLCLVGRRRDGIRVTYELTEQGRQFSLLGEIRE